MHRLPFIGTLVSGLASLTLFPATTRAQTVSEPEPAAPPPLPSVAMRSPLAPLPEWNNLTRFAHCLTQQEFEQAMDQIYLAKTPFPVPWLIGPDGLEVQTGQGTGETIRIPFVKRGEPPSQAPRYWRTASELPPVDGRLPLSDLHVGIDPGHIGGGYGAIEERRLSMTPGEAIQEGDLTLLTAQLLEQRLKALGAYVTLVRKSAAPVTTAKPAEFEVIARQTLEQAGFKMPPVSYNGITGDARMLTVQWQSEKLFYRVAEIRARADLVNQQIKPDVVLCLHFNAEAWGDAVDPQFSDRNHLHLMINGCYSNQEVAHQDQRFELLQRVFTKVHLEEQALIRPMARAMAIRTRLPPYTYNTPNAKRISDDPYVYARNLLASRLYQCPVIYFEPYVMNHEETYQRLLHGHWVGRTRLNDVMQTSPVEDYVQSIVDGLMAHYPAHRPS